jgi:hydrogenase maturation protein HypF
MTRWPTKLLGQPYPIRRARGYAPDSLALPSRCSPLLAAGPELKNTFCLARDRYAFLSHHIGDMENYETCARMKKASATLSACSACSQS